RARPLPPRSSRTLPTPPPIPTPPPPRRPAMDDLAVLDHEPSAPADPADPAATPARAAHVAVGPAVLRGEALVKRYGQTEALRGIDVEVGRGEILAVMGPSGSGKSTLLHCLAAIVRPDAGSVLYDGGRIDDLGESDRTKLRRNAFGFVFQFGQLVPELPAVENVALPLLLDGRRRAAALDDAHHWFRRLATDSVE